jgi:hypothetical protein
VVLAIWFGLRNGRVEESKMASSVREERDDGFEASRKWR